jgi:hypothetical protein
MYGHNFQHVWPVQTTGYRDSESGSDSYLLVFDINQNVYLLRLYCGPIRQQN